MSWVCSAIVYSARVGPVPHEVGPADLGRRFVVVVVFHQNGCKRGRTDDRTGFRRAAMLSLGLATTAANDYGTDAPRKMPSLGRRTGGLQSVPAFFCRGP